MSAQADVNEDARARALMRTHDIQRRHKTRIYRRSRVADSQPMLLAQLTSEAVLDAAFDWLCRRRRHRGGQQELVARAR